MEKEQYVAKLSFVEFPDTDYEKERVINWLKNIITAVKNSEEEKYSKKCSFRLMK